MKGQHSIKVGYEFRHHQFNFHGWAASYGRHLQFQPLGTGGYDASGNNLASTGDPFASFLLGQVHTANFTIPAFTTFNGKFHSTYINDEYKVTSRLNLTLGLRFDYQGPWTERFDRFSTFDPDYAEPGGRRASGRAAVRRNTVRGAQAAELSTTFQSMPLAHASASRIR